MTVTSVYKKRNDILMQNYHGDTEGTEKNRRILYVSVVKAFFLSLLW
jgi:hypothetical protein